MMRRLVSTLLLMAALPAAAAETWAEWTIHPKPRDEFQFQDIELHYLLGDEQGYRLMKLGARTDPRFELVGIDQKNRTIWLMASPFESADAKQKPGNVYKCKSLSEPRNRKSFYSICNSRFAVQRGELAEVDIDKLRQALDQAGFLSAMTETRLAKYRADYARATTAPSLKRFIEQYKNDDPENLVPLAQKKIPGQALEDYRAGFTRAMNTPLRDNLGDPGIFRKAALKQFFEFYRNNDPEQLAAKANDEYLKMLAADERERQRHFEAVGQPGTTVCLDVHTNPSLDFDETRWREAAFAQIVGSTEQSTPTKLKVYVHQITAWKLHDAYAGKALANANVDGLNVSPGGYSWFDRAGWRVCGPK